ncbi:MAG: extracellular solute-binding protein [Deltaproteobacteria bacterium]|nr:extracellular solute-binding protein [Deltaproteobacteria bacterium]
MKKEVTKLRHFKSFFALMAALFLIAGLSIQIPSAQAAGEGKVRFYTSMPTEFAAQMINVFNQKKMGVEAELFYAPTYTTLEKLMTELRANRVMCDVLLIADPGPFLDLKKKGELLEYKSPEAQYYPKDHQDKDGYWVNGRSIATNFAYNKNIISEADAPKTWWDLTDPKWKGKIGILDVRVGGTGYCWYYTLRKKFGTDYWKKLAKNEPKLFRGHGQQMDKMLTGELPITEQLGYYVRTNIVKKGAPIKGVYASPTPITMAPIAIIKRGPNNEGAKKFVDWWLSLKGQTLLQELNGCYSVRKGVPALSGKPAYDSLETIEYNWEEYNEVRMDLIDEFSEIFGL